MRSPRECGEGWPVFVVPVPDYRPDTARAFFDIEDGASWFDGLSQQAHVDDLIGLLPRDDHLVARVDGNLNIVADSHVRMRSKLRTGNISVGLVPPGDRGN